MNKYHNEPITLDGIRFQSKREAYRWQELRLLQRAGEIKNLQRQVPFVICPACKMMSGKSQTARKYVADFVYTDKTGRLVVEDAKGVKTDVYKLKKALMLYFHGIEIQEV